MSPTRLRECLAVLRWSQRGLAEVLGCDHGMVRGWARGARPIPPEAATWLEALAAPHFANPLPAGWRSRPRPRDHRADTQPLTEP